MSKIIAEFGSSPRDYEWDFARWCDAAHTVGADMVKVQVFRASHFPPPHDQLKLKDEFPRARLGEFSRAAHTHGLAAGASVFDREAIALVSAHLDFMKLAAREQDNAPLFEAARKSGAPLYRSISHMETEPSSTGLVTLFAIQKYPAGMAESLLMLTLWKFYNWSRFNGRWGWSSHTRGMLDCILAAKFGAEVIEKHFALSRNDCEARHSLLPHQFARMVKLCQ